MSNRFATGVRGGRMDKRAADEADASRCTRPLPRLSLVQGSISVPPTHHALPAPSCGYPIPGMRSRHFDSVPVL